MITTIVFDFGNVIGFFDHRRATRVLAAHTPLAEEKLFAHIYDPQLEDDYESGRLSSAEFLERVHRLGQFTCAHEAIGEAYSDIFWPNEDVCRLVPQLRPTYRLLLGSNTTELHSLRFRREFADTLRHFDHLVLSHEIKVRKPLPGFFEHCQRQAQAQPQECVFIDDLPANVNGARACGWHGVVYRDAADLRQRLLDLGVTMT